MSRWTLDDRPTSRGRRSKASATPACAARATRTHEVCACSATTPTRVLERRDPISRERKNDAVRYRLRGASWTRSGRSSARHHHRSSAVMDQAPGRGGRVAHRDRWGGVMVAPTLQTGGATTGCRTWTRDRGGRGTLATGPRPVVAMTVLSGCDRRAGEARRVGADHRRGEDGGCAAQAGVRRPRKMGGVLTAPGVPDARGRRST